MCVTCASDGSAAFPPPLRRLACLPAALFYCKNCERLVNFSIRFKEFYDRVDVKTSVLEMKKKSDDNDPSDGDE